MYQKSSHYKFDILSSHSTDCLHAVFPRNGGKSEEPFSSLNVRYGIGDSISNVKENRLIIAQELGIDPKNLISANQTHSSNLCIIKKNDSQIPADYSLTPVGEVDDVDAFISNHPDKFFMIQVADCQPIILFDPHKKVVAAIHSGWRGTANNIVGTTVQEMINHFQTNPAELIACIAPSLGPCCSEFKSRNQDFPSQYHQFFLPADHVDLWEITRFQLLEKGLQLENIEFANICTCCHSDEFFSYRTAEQTGRFATIIGLNNKT